MRVLGVDGCRGRWVIASVTDGEATWEMLDNPDALMGRRVDAIGIDVPIGLPESGPRRCDIAARARIGPRRSSVFPAPPRCVLEAGSYDEARTLLRERGVPSMSAQAFGIVQAIRSVDVAMSPRFEDRVIETHPEVSFAELAQSELAPKKTAAGVAQRLQALDLWLSGALQAVASAPVGVPIDDALDALACAWSAQRFATGQAEELGDGTRDSRGLLMRIVV
jgi:predicted RNase H-like nuclease